MLAMALISGIAFLLRTGGSAPVNPQRPRPALGSPAQVWLERGERVHAEIRASVARQPGWAIISADAENVVTDLADTADRVAAINTALKPVDLGQLTAQRDQLAAELAGSDTAGSDTAGSDTAGSDTAGLDDTAEADTRAAHDAVSRRLERVQQRLAERDALLAKMRAAVLGLEHCRHEVDNLLEDESPAQRESTAPILALTTRLAGLRAGLSEVRAISDAGADPDRTVPFANPRPERGMDGGMDNGVDNRGHPE